MSQKFPTSSLALIRYWPALALIVRVALGGVFVFSGVMKLDQPLLFAQAIMKFGVVDPQDHEHLIKVATFAIPWTEILCGTALLLGLWTRAAALLLAMALGIFTLLIVGVVVRGESFECSCFGRLRLLCAPRLGWCNVVQNFLLLSLAAVLVAGGGGRWGLDRFRPR